jgi:hypothetical protein
VLLFLDNFVTLQTISGLLKRKTFPRRETKKFPEKENLRRRQNNKKTVFGKKNKIINNKESHKQQNGN